MRNLLIVSFLTLVGCGGGEPCALHDPVGSCENGQVCEDVAGAPTCVEPVVVRGVVRDRAGAPIGGALVVALDANDAPASGTAKTDAAGKYELRVPTPRVAGGAPAMYAIKLRAAAAGFETFPFGIRRSLPIELSAATVADGKRVVESAQTEIVLFPVADAAGLGSIAGTIGIFATQIGASYASRSGALVVVEGPVSATGVADVGGVFEVFNLPPGTYTVNGYVAGANLKPATAQVTAGGRAEVDLAFLSSASGVSVTGSVNIVNAPGGARTSVVLVPVAAFNETLERGEVPPGLRAPESGAPSVSGAFSIDGVPDGTYKVLAAFENDDLVRDPDPGIAGTQIVEISVAGASVALPESFKITEALAVVSPGGGDAPDKVTGNPTFTWKDDSSEDKYTVELFDGKGNVVLPPTDVPAASGSGNVTFTYPGTPALVKGEYYQFRATSWRKGGPIATTEDLKGVFIAD